MKTSLIGRGGYTVNLDLLKKSAAASVVAVLLASAPSAMSETNILVAVWTTGVLSYGVGGASDGTSLGTFASGTSLNMAMGADRSGDGKPDLYVATGSSISIFNGVSGGSAVASYGGTGSAVGMSADPSNGDFYYTTYNTASIRRFDTNGLAKPGTGPGDTFMPVTVWGSANDKDTWGLVIGPDLTLYYSANRILTNNTSSGFLGNAGGVPFSSIIMSPIFGPDVTGDGKLELYVADYNNNAIKVVDVFTDPNNWTLQSAYTLSGLSAPCDIAFAGNEMYIAEEDARVDRYTLSLSGTHWTADPSTGQSGATFAIVPNVRGVLFQDSFEMLAIPEPSAMVLLSLSGLLIWRRRCS